MATQTAGHQQAGPGARPVDEEALAALSEAVRGGIVRPGRPGPRPGPDTLFRVNREMAPAGGGG